MGKEYTLNQIAKQSWAHLPKYQREANLEWLKELHRVLELGGNWVWPETGIIFEKTHTGFKLIGQLPE